MGHEESGKASMLKTKADVRLLEAKCTEVRLALLDEVEVAGSGHYGSCLSAIEIFVSLYYSLLDLRPTEPRWPGRDRFVLSKGHACSAVYPILADLGFFPKEELKTFTRLGSHLGDHPDMNKVAGFDFSSGSLGHGLSVAVGMAEAVRLQGHGSRVTALMGDGELNEGQIWEAAAYAGHRRLSNLLGIVDINTVSVDGKTKQVLEFEPLEDKWRAFGWQVERLDGHDLEALLAAYDRFDAQRATAGARPTVILADTIAGRGISFIEGMAEWHVGYLGGADRDRAVRDINAMYAESTGTEGERA
jgi:transketolase